MCPKGTLGAHLRCQYSDEDSCLLQSPVITCEDINNLNNLNKLYMLLERNHNSRWIINPAVGCNYLQSCSGSVYPGVGCHEYFQLNTVSLPVHNNTHIMIGL